jgi:hypothetical protein
MIQRLESFDSDENHRISRQELPERMQAMFSRADANADAALDSKEIRGLVDAAESRHKPVPCVAHPTEGLPGVINDLKLTPDKYANALAIVNAAQLSPLIDQSTAANVRAKMRQVLDDGEYESFVAAAARLPGGPQSMPGLRPGVRQPCFPAIEKP